MTGIADARSPGHKWVHVRTLTKVIRAPDIGHPAWLGQENIFGFGFGAGWAKQRFGMSDPVFFTPKIVTS
jgi:hypothetical protein